MAIKVSTSTVQKIILLTCFFRLIFILLASVNPLKINPILILSYVYSIPAGASVVVVNLAMFGGFSVVQMVKQSR